MPYALVGGDGADDLLMSRVDLFEAERFLYAIEPGESCFTFQTFDDDRERDDPALRRVLNGTLEEHAVTLAELNAHGAGVFVAVNETDLRGRARRNMRRARVVFIEADEPLPRELRQVPTITTETSPGKFHHLFRAPDLTLPMFHRIQTALVEHWGSDRNAKDASRVLRLPGFDHMKRAREGRRFRTRIVDELSSGKVFTVAEVLDAFEIAPPSDALRKAVGGQGALVATNM